MKLFWILLILVVLLVLGPWGLAAAIVVAIAWAAIAIIGWLVRRA